MNFADVLGQGPIKEVMGRAVRSGRPAQAYILAGPAGMGKGALSLAFARALNCRQPADGVEPCGACPSCRQIAAGSHPDVRQVEPAGSTLKLDLVREVLRDAYLRPFSGRFKFFLLHQADRLSDEAASSLLKVLEEPPGYAVFLLLTAHPGALLPTIRSRCQLLPLRPVPEEEMVAWLRGQAGLEEAEARFLARWTRGNPGLARDLAGSPRLLEARQLGRQMANLCLARPDGSPDGSPGRSASLEALDLASRLDGWVAAGGADGGRAAGDLLDALAWVLRDRLAASAGASADLLLDAAGAEPLPRVAARDCLDALAEVDAARQALKSNANRRLVFEVLAVKLRGMNREAII